MTSLMQAVARTREDVSFPPNGDVHVNLLQDHFQSPGTKGSVRELIAAMIASGAVQHSYAVILCRFQGEPPHPDEAKWLKFFTEAFTRGTGGLVEYWRDASLGVIDVSGSRVFPWIEVSLTRKQGGFPPTMRQDLTNAGISAIQNSTDPLTGKPGDPITGFFNQISCYMYRDNGEGKNIDGSTDGISNKTNLTAPFDGEVTAHEMGHSQGMDHDADVTGDTKYHDKCCIMSQSGSFSVSPWEVVFGPSLCLPHLMLQGWMYKKRMLFDTGAWATNPEGITFQLAPNTEAGSPAFLGASLSVPGSSPAWEYLLEVAPLSGWNQGVANLPALMIRRTSSQTDLAPSVTAMYLGQLPINSTGSTTMTEASGNTTFTVSQVSTRGPTVTVTAKKS
jgi:hypothetical protein